MDENTSRIIDVIKQDLKVAEKYLASGKYRDITVIGNRTHSNLLIETTKNKNLILIGWILREIAGELEKIKQTNETSEKEVSEHAKECLRTINEILQNKSYNRDGLWSAYFDWERSVLKYLLTDEERTIYTGKPEFTKEFTIFLFDYFLTNKELIYETNNELIVGVLSELTRVINKHSANDTEFLVYLVFKVFYSYYEYAKFSSQDASGKLDKELVKNKLKEYLLRIEEIRSLIYKTEVNALHNAAVSLIYDLTIEFRKNFINYNELHIQYVQQQKIELPDDAKREISKLVANAFEEKAK